MAKEKRGPKKPAQIPQAAKAFAEVEPELDRLSMDMLRPVNIDIPYSVSVVLGLMPSLTELRAEIVKQLPHFPIEMLDRLDKYALATWYSHLLAQPPASPENPLKPLLEEGTKLRATMLSDAEALARRELVSAVTVAEIRSGSGNYDTANDLVALSALFNLDWDSIKNRTAATEAEVQRAGELGTAILVALGLAEQGTVNRPIAAERRKRAFTLFMRAYDQVQRAVTYLRWNEGDADDLAPSLYKGRGGRGSGSSEPDPVKTEPSTTTETRPPTPSDPTA
jgi:transcriptional regulator with XRE-family HTH domain